MVLAARAKAAARVASAGVAASPPLATPRVAAAPAAAAPFAATVEPAPPPPAPAPAPAPAAPPTEEERFAAELGIPVASAPDLLWVARRALVAKVPEGASAVPYFRALAGRLLSPAWPEAEAAEETPKSGAWTRATAVAAFAGQNGTELSCAKDEPLLIDFGDPGADGWVTAARWPDARETGLVPESYLRKHDFRVVASTAYEAASDGELSFAAGETLVVRTGVLPSRGWWLACVRGRRGYAPRHILDEEWRQQAARNVAAIWGLWRHHRRERFARVARAALRGALRLSDGRAVAVKRSDPAAAECEAEGGAGGAGGRRVALPAWCVDGRHRRRRGGGRGRQREAAALTCGRARRLSAAARVDAAAEAEAEAREVTALTRHPQQALASEDADEGDGGGGGGGGGGAADARRRGVGVASIVRVSAARSHPRRHQASSRDERRCAALVRPTSAALIRRLCCPRHLEWSRRRRRADGRRAGGRSGPGAQPRQCEAEAWRRAYGGGDVSLVVAVVVARGAEGRV